MTDAETAEQEIVQLVNDSLDLSLLALPGGREWVALGRALGEMQLVDDPMGTAYGWAVGLSTEAEALEVKEFNEKLVALWREYNTGKISEEEYQRLSDELFASLRRR